MIFIDYWRILVFVVPPTFILAGVWGFRSLRSKRAMFWLPIKVVAIGIVPLSCIALFIVGCGTLMTETTYSSPIFSPDHKSALRLSYYDGGAFGGSTSIEMFTNHGLKTGWIMRGYWKTVEPRDVHWLSNAEVLLGYGGDDTRSPECRDYGGIKVICHQIIDPSR